MQSLFHSVQLNVNNPHFLIMQGRITKVRRGGQAGRAGGGTRRAVLARCTHLLHPRAGCSAARAWLARNPHPHRVLPPHPPSLLRRSST